ncbi:ribosome maturation factor RimP [Nakamurella leprariae]|uniref:Ribosome maturation factor RimP n=1 Tax=Nakamurella leprariae TaxID=2803911 RepID=A0A938YDJ1_9ACTN|nr:ribosome maturation factor RimP [Nakamurella leprariae]MBM9465875.1 ribosome maturation factor RimP [Nakamurella leprariae]
MSQRGPAGNSSGREGAGTPGGTSGPGRRDAELWSLAERVAAERGFDLEDVTVVAAGRRRLVRLVIDRDGGVELDAAAEVSRALSAALDEAEQSGTDPMGGAPYTLEVTSPGIGRPLTLPRHFRRARGRMVAFRRVDGTTLTARVAGADDEHVQVLTGCDGLQPDTVALADIERAVVEVEFSPVPAAVAQALGLTPASEPVDLDDTELDDTEVDDTDHDSADLGEDSDVSGSDPAAPTGPADRSGGSATGGTR